MQWTLEMFGKRLLVVLGIAVVFSLLLFYGKMTNLRALLWGTGIMALCAYGWYMESNLSYRKAVHSKLIGIGLFLLYIALAMLICFVCGLALEYLFDWHAAYWEITALKGFGLCFCLRVLYELGKSSAWWFDVPQMIYTCFMWLVIFAVCGFIGWGLTLFVWPLLPF